VFDYICNLRKRCSCVARVLASGNANEGAEPRYSWTNHTLPITDVHVGCGGCRARVVTASRDKTVKVSISVFLTIILLMPLVALQTWLCEAHAMEFCCNCKEADVHLVCGISGLFFAPFTCSIFHNPGDYKIVFRNLLKRFNFS